MPRLTTAPQTPPLAGGAVSAQEEVEEAIRKYHAFKRVILSVLQTPEEDCLFNAGEILKEAGAEEALRRRILEPSRLIDPDHEKSVILNPSVGQRGHVPWNSHPGTSSLRRLLQDLTQGRFGAAAESSRLSLIRLYQTYHQRLQEASPQVRNSLLNHQALLFDLDGSAYRIPMDQARYIRGIDLYGGSLRREGQSGNHTVVPLPSRENPQVWFKSPSSITDLDPGMEMAVYGLYRLLLGGKWGGGAAPTRLLVLDDVEIKAPAHGTDALAALNEMRGRGQSIDDYKREYPQYAHQLLLRHEHYILQASEHVNGTPLDRVIERLQAISDAPERREAYARAINSQSFSALVLSSFLLNPSDYKGDNLILTSGGHIVGIDNDGMLGLPVRVTDTRHHFHLKNILYLLPLMERPVDAEVKEHFLALSPEGIAAAWLSYLLEQNKYDASLVVRKILNREETPGEKDTKWLPLKFRPRMGEELIHKMRTLQERLRAPGITHQALFDLFVPGVSYMYREILRRSGGNPLTAMNAIYEGGAVENIFDLEREQVSRILPDGRVDRVSLRKTLQRDMEQFKREQQGEGAEELEGRISTIEETVKSLADTLYAYKREDQETLKGQQLVDLQMLVERIRVQEESNQRNPPSPQQGGLQGEHIIQELQKIALSRHLTLRTLGEQALLGGHDALVSHLLERGLFHDLASPRLMARYWTRHFRLNPSGPILRAFVPWLKNNREFSYERALNLIFSRVEELPANLSQNPPFIFKESVWEAGEHKVERRVLNPAVLEQVLRPDGTFKRVGEHGRRIVAKATLGGHTLYLKVLPELPGIEEEVGALMRGILGYGTPHTRLLRAESRGEALPILVSEGIDGTLLQDATPDMLSRLNPERFSALILMTMLTMPEDGKRDNYVVRKLETRGAAAEAPREEYEIIPIDNDRSFVPAIAREEIQDRGVRNALQVKTVLYCLDDMNYKIDPATRNVFINHNPGEKLLNWLLSLVQKGKAYEKLFPSSQERERLYTHHQSFIGIPFRPESVAGIYRKLMKMQRLLEANPFLTHLQLLSEIEPILEDRYGWILSQSLSLAERFDLVDGEYFGREGARRITMSSTADVLSGMRIENRREMRDFITSGHKYSPEIALIELLEEINREVNILGLQTIETSERLEETLESNERKRLSVQEQQRFLEEFLTRLKNHPPLRNITKLDLSGMNVVESRHLSRFPDLPNLTYADLSGTGIDSVTPLLGHTPNLQYLVLENCVNLRRLVQETRRFGRDPDLILPRLKSLRAGHNPNLICVRLTAPELEALNLNDTPVLERDLDLSTPNLKRLSLEGRSFNNYYLKDLIEKIPALKVLNITEDQAVDILRYSWEDEKKKRMDALVHSVVLRVAQNPGHPKQWDAIAALWYSQEYII